MGKKVCIIIPYFGKWPSYLKLFLKSCSFNPELKILFFTDLSFPSSYPENVIFNHFSLREIKAAMDRILNMDTAITNPYKLCDVRPAYGLIFDKYIKEFDYWGWGDIDVLYGKLTDFLSDKPFEDFDIISMRKNWLSGSLTFVRNEPVPNALFLNGNNLKKIFESSAYMGFDEISGCWSEIRKRDYSEIKWPNDNFTRIVREASRSGKVKSYFNDHIKESINTNSYLTFDTGSLKDKEGNIYLLYHFITEKRQAFFTYPIWNKIPDKFIIDRTGFYSSQELRTRRLVGFGRILFSIPGTIIRKLVKKLFPDR